MTDQKREIVERVRERYQSQGHWQSTRHQIRDVLQAADHFKLVDRLEKAEAALSRVAKDNIVWSDFNTGASPCRGCQRKISIASAELKGGE